MPSRTVSKNTTLDIEVEMVLKALISNTPVVVAVPDRMDVA